jgi:polysaccharide export outer membrane protein
MNRLSKLHPLIVVILFGTFLSSCGSVKLYQMRMMEDIQTDAQVTLDSIPPLKIQPDDILGIEVASRNPETVLAFQVNRTRTVRGTAGAEALGGTEGYRVDEEGNIYLPFIDKVEANGKTLMELRNDITERLSEFIPDVSVQVRYLNFRVTVLGEVLRPSTYIIPNEKLTILEAIGMAGDFTPYAERSKVLVIRERQQKREFARVDTQNKELFKSPYFYLSPNDIVYVEPLKAKQYATTGDFIQRYSIVLVPIISVLSSVAVAAIYRN